MVRRTDRPSMTIAEDLGHKETNKQMAPSKAIVCVRVGTYKQG